MREGTAGGLSRRHQAVRRSAWHRDDSPLHRICLEGQPVVMATRWRKQRLARLQQHDWQHPPLEHHDGNQQEVGIQCKLFLRRTECCLRYLHMPRCWHTSCCCSPSQCRTEGRTLRKEGSQKHKSLSSQSLCSVWLVGTSSEASSLLHKTRRCRRHRQGSC